MVDFKIISTLKTAKMRITRKNGIQEDINVKRPAYRDVLELSWRNKKYKIIRSGTILRESRIYKEGEYLAGIRERLGIMTHFDIYRKAKHTFGITEEETLFKHGYTIKNKKGTIIGTLRPTGLYIPIISSTGKGYEGEYTGITKDEEETLLLSLLALCI
jgi:hypothetical protein